MLRSTVESVRSRCQREIGSLLGEEARAARSRGRGCLRRSRSRSGSPCAASSTSRLRPAIGRELEVAQADVAPDVAAQVDHDGVEARERMAILRDPIVRLDLRRVARRGQPERRDEAVRDREPVHIGIRDDVRVEVADGAVELAADLDGRELLALPLRAGRRSSRAPCRASSASRAGRACARASATSASLCACARSSIASCFMSGSSTRWRASRSISA